MRRLLADTSFLVALRDSGDSNHEAAVEWLRSALDSGPLKLVVTNYILAEVHAFFCRFPAVAVAYAERLRGDPLFQVVRAGPEVEAEAWALLRRSGDKTYSFTDAASFAVARRLGLREALAFDAHFRQHGRFLVSP